MKLLAGSLVAAIGLWSVTALAQHSDDPTPTVAWGATVYLERCALCHGGAGAGDGTLPSSVEGYPDTSLLESSLATLPAIREAVVWGGSTGKQSPLSPPWGDELTWSEIESVSLFTEVLLSNPNSAKALLAQASDNSSKEMEHLGRSLFESRCALCHGQYGEGNGRMAKVIKNPPPYNLTKSVVPEHYLKMIITNGGESVGRSVQMPPWKDEFTGEQIDAVISYIVTLRK